MATFLVTSLWRHITGVCSLCQRPSSGRTALQARSAALTAATLFLWLVWWPGTLCRTIFGTRTLAWTASYAVWRRSCGAKAFCSIIAYSAVLSCVAACLMCHCSKLRLSTWFQYRLIIIIIIIISAFRVVQVLHVDNLLTNMVVSLFWVSL